MRQTAKRKGNFYEKTGVQRIKETGNHGEML